MFILWQSKYNCIDYWYFSNHIIICVGKPHNSLFENNEDHELTGEKFNCIEETFAESVLEIVYQNLSGLSGGTITI